MTDLREKILESATQCFIRFGYNKTTLEDIGKSVNLKKNSLYHYFKNKEDIFLTVIKKEMNKMVEKQKEEISKIKGIKNKILTYIKMRLESCNKNSIITSIITEIMHPNHPLFETILNIFKESETSYLEALFNNAYEKNEIIKYDYKKLSESILTLSNAMKQNDITNKSINSNPKITQIDKNIIFIIETMLKGIYKK